MNVLYYANAAGDGDFGLVDMIHRKLPMIHIESVTSIGRLYQKMCQPLNQISAIIAVLRTSTDIDGLLSMNALFEDIRLILLVTGSARNEAKLIHSLAPSFVCESERQLNDIVSVLTHLENKKAVK